MNFMVKCCECNRVRLEGKWTPNYPAVEGKVLFSHSYCPECLGRIMAQLEAWHPAPELEPAPAPLDLHPVAGG